MFFLLTYVFAEFCTYFLKREKWSQIPFLNENSNVNKNYATYAYITHILQYKKPYIRKW